MISLKFKRNFIHMSMIFLRCAVAGGCQKNDTHIAAEPSRVIPYGHEQEETRHDLLAILVLLVHALNMRIYLSGLRLQLF